MNKIEADILMQTARNPELSQRTLAAKAGCSLGLVNRSVKELIRNQYIDEEKKILPAAEDVLEAGKPRSAIILAAGYGMRMVPINTEIPKGLLEIQSEPLIERLIVQLHEAGIQDISIVVGYMKEQYEYLIDQYGVRLIVNMEYAQKNNLTSLAKAADRLSNTYIVPCDLYARENPFSSQELYSWYMVDDQMDEASSLKITRSGGFTETTGHRLGNHMVGISYIHQDDAPALVNTLKKMAADPACDHDFWETALIASDIPVWPKEVKAKDVVEINTYEQLRNLDENSDHLNSPAISAICEAFDIDSSEITDIQVLKKGMTNRSFLFEVHGERYIMRIPGEGTDQLINRQEEGQVYEVIRDLHLCDDIIYINPENGYKITKYLEDTHTCQIDDWAETARCMTVLRQFHHRHLEVDHDFDLFRQIEFYESLRPGKSVFRDYEATKQRIMKLKPWLDSIEKERTLCHIDSVPDNFLILPDGTVRLIDWEYAGMQDPHLDLAMFCIYAMYNTREDVDHLIDLYFEKQCDPQTRLKIYYYIATAGLLWSNWCEYKASLGQEFGEYALRQYRFAKEYGRLVEKELNHV